MNCDKGTISEQEVEKRIEPFLNLQRLLILTRYYSFVAKATLFPGVNFYLGSDTIERVNDPKYYLCEKERDRCISLIQRARSRFTVFERNGIKLDDLTLSPALRAICTAANFTPMNVSSTEIRNARPN